MKEITKVIASDKNLALVEVKNTKKADWKHEPDYVWTTYEIQRDGLTLIGGGIVGLHEEYKRMVKSSKKEF